VIKEKLGHRIDGWIHTLFPFLFWRPINPDVLTLVGMLIAAAAVHFYDVLDLTRVLLQLTVWLVPTFYPLEMVPETFQFIIKINPLFSYLEVFRGFMYRGEFAPTWNFVMMAVSAFFFLAIGVWVFSKSWRNMIVKL